MRTESKKMEDAVGPHMWFGWAHSICKDESTENYGDDGIDHMTISSKSPLYTMRNGDSAWFSAENTDVFLFLQVLLWWHFPWHVRVPGVSRHLSGKWWGGWDGDGKRKVWVFFLVDIGSKTHVVHYFSRYFLRCCGTLRMFSVFCFVFMPGAHSTCRSIFICI